jgi:hypothetical protein
MKTSMHGFGKGFGPLGLLGLICLTCLTCLIGNYTAIAQDAELPAARDGQGLVGTWYLALDSVPFGLPPGFPLSGLMQFQQSGTYQILDGGDFGQATFTNTQNSQQFGAWRRDRNGSFVGTALFLEADLPTGEVLRWVRTQFLLATTPDADVIEGIVNIATLECGNQLPLPTPLTCPDPIASADQFVLVPPADIPLTLRRLHAR